MPAAMWSSHSQLTVNLNRRISDSITDMKNMTSLQAFKTTMQYRLEREENSDMPTAWAYWNSTERNRFKTERRIELSQHES
jgi:murein L,D-transpeptidase YafK